MRNTFSNVSRDMTLSLASSMIRGQILLPSKRHVEEDHSSLRSQICHHFDMPLLGPLDASFRREYWRVSTSVSLVQKAGPAAVHQTMLLCTRGSSYIGDVDVDVDRDRDDSDHVTFLIISS